MRYKVITPKETRDNKGKGFEFNEARNLARKLRESGLSAEVVTLRAKGGVKYGSTT